MENIILVLSVVLIKLIGNYRINLLLFINNLLSRYLIEFDDGAKRYVKSNEIISQSFLVTNQDVMAQTLDGRFHQGIVKHIIKKKKTGNLGYIIEKDGKEKWYPLRFVSLTSQQAENLQTISKPTDGKMIFIHFISLIKIVFKNQQLLFKVNVNESQMFLKHQIKKLKVQYLSHPAKLNDQVKNNSFFLLFKNNKFSIYTNTSNEII